MGDPGMKIMTATEPADVAQMAMIETMRSIRDTMKGMQSEMRDQHALVTDVRERVIRIESNEVSRRVKALEDRVDELERDRDKRDGAIGAWQWLVKNSPSLAAMLTALVLVIFLILRANGRV